MSSGDTDLIALTVLGVFVLIVVVTELRRKKTIPMTIQDVALKLGLSIKTSGKDQLLDTYSFINRLQYSGKQHIQNVLCGTYRKSAVTVFDMRYETRDIGKGGSQDYYSFYMVELPKTFPELTIYKEGLISKLYQATGHSDIDFESYEFSAKFRVRAANAKFAYDFCNALMIDYLLANTDLSIEIDRNILCISFEKPLSFETVGHSLDRLLKIRSLMPNYLFEE
ncbi:hypothetical protein [Pontiella sulfatireligans]|uniref:Uncharacterized protein n=1 Tax=Pontiella sulfatireligans TaxID=2750658 RepID=A0A6C2UN21_9BACT|nr:hypothetical protein [Pontiella sulfatireligans]VGO21333.1 hypothetical protein SCARR_03405 [Pontiella sulfatireligans]